MKKILAFVLVAFALGVFLPSLQAQPATGKVVAPAKAHKKHRRHHRRRHHHHHHHKVVVILK